MKKPNLFKATFFGILCGFFAIIPIFYLHSHVGLILTFLATVHAVICVTELGIPIRSYLLVVIALHLSYLIATVMPNVTITNYKAGVLWTGLASIVTLLSGLTIAAIKVRKLSKSGISSIVNQEENPITE